MLEIESRYDPAVHGGLLEGRRFDEAAAYCQQAKVGNAIVHSKVVAQLAGSPLSEFEPSKESLKFLSAQIQLTTGWAHLSGFECIRV
jgi:hypothetical protein